MNWKITIDRPEGHLEANLEIDTDEPDVLDKVETALQQAGITIERNV